MNYHTKLYRCWSDIKQRCYNPNCHQYPNYGGRGITMFEPWIDNFKLFESYVLLLDHPEGTSIDKVCNDEGYYPMNLKYSTKKEQANNRREMYDRKVGSSGFKWVTFNGRTYTGKYKYRGQSVYVGSFPTAPEAFASVCKHRLTLGLKCPIL